LACPLHSFVAKQDGLSHPISRFRWFALVIKGVDSPPAADRQPHSGRPLRILRLPQSDARSWVVICLRAAEMREVERPATGGFRGLANGLKRDKPGAGSKINDGESVGTHHCVHCSLRRVGPPRRNRRSLCPPGAPPLRPNPGAPSLRLARRLIERAKEWFAPRVAQRSRSRSLSRRWGTAISA